MANLRGSRKRKASAVVDDDDILSTAKTPSESGEDVYEGIAPFLVKVYVVVEDAACDDIISWAASGKSFIVHDPERFAREILPQFSKSKSFSSFVRQLNMYNFRKVIPPKSGIDVHTTEWEFTSPHFRRGHLEMLRGVKRKGAATGAAGTAGASTGTTSARQLCSELESVKAKQAALQSRFESLETDNRLVQSSIFDLRDRYENQQNTINRIMQFLAQMVTQGRARVSGSGGKRSTMLDGGSVSADPSPAVPVVTSPGSTPTTTTLPAKATITPLDDDGAPTTSALPIDSSSWAVVQAHPLSLLPAAAAAAPVTTAPTTTTTTTTTVDDLPVAALVDDTHQLREQMDLIQNDLYNIEQNLESVDDFDLDEDDFLNLSTPL